LAAAATLAAGCGSSASSVPKMKQVTALADRVTNGQPTCPLTDLATVQRAAAQTLRGVHLDRVKAQQQTSEVPADPSGDKTRPGRSIRCVFSGSNPQYTASVSVSVAAAQDYTRLFDVAAQQKNSGWIKRGDHYLMNPSEPGGTLIRAVSADIAVTVNVDLAIPQSGADVPPGSTGVSVEQPIESEQLSSATR
jgi:hypothetical protein